MTLEPPVNPNYCATVIEVKTLVPIPNADRIQAMPMLGMQAVVGLDTHVGQLGLLFPAGVQLSDEYTKFNNLYREASMNRNPDAPTGFVEEKHRRVKAISLRKARSDALFMPLESLLGCTDRPMDLFDLKEGDTFDYFNGHEICRKYVRPYRGHGQHNQMPSRRATRVDERHFPRHIETTHFLRVAETLAHDERTVITQKLHGTSIRVGHVPVARPPKNFWERIAERYFGITVEEHMWDLVFGSRKVILDPNNPNQNSFYDYNDDGDDIYTEEGRKLAGLIPAGYIVYGELIGWSGPETALQKNYTYDCLPGTRQLYVYRVAHVNRDGFSADLSWDAVVEFCFATGLNPVPTLGYATVKELLTDVGGKPFIETYLDRVFSLDYPQAVPLSEGSPVDEGVCIRIEGIVPSIYKAKSPLFQQHESKMLDEGAVDAEEDANQELVPA